MANTCARQPRAGDGGPAVVCPWCNAAMLPPDAATAALAPGRLFCAAGCAVECDSRARRWWTEGARVPDGAAFPSAPARAALALPLPADWRP
jgi:hypothetical protein